MKISDLKHTYGFSSFRASSCNRIIKMLLFPKGMCSMSINLICMQVHEGQFIAFILSNCNFRQAPNKIRLIDYSFLYAVEYFRQECHHKTL